MKAPDWAYVPAIRVPREEVKRSYTPQLQGDIPVIVMEFLSDTEGGKYSNKPTYPPGKWFFYERVLQIPNYVIFEPDSGRLEVYQLDDAGRYQLQSPDTNHRYWIAQMGLFLGLWQGSREIARATGYAGGIKRGSFSCGDLNELSDWQPNSEQLELSQSYEG